MSQALALRPWILALRPKTLSAAVVPVLVGSALAYGLTGRMTPALAVYAVLGAVFIQIGTNLFNDAIDFKKGADTAERVGPVRVTQSQMLSSRWVMAGGGLFFLLAVLCGIPLVIKGGAAIVAIGVLSLLMGYAYTGGPFPLAYLGLGDLFVILFFGLVAVGGVFFLHTLAYSWPAFVAGLQVGLLATVLIAINNYRDHLQDVKAHKRTLAVRFGPRFAKGEVVGLLSAAFAMLPLWLLFGKPWAALFPLISAPLAFSVARDVLRTPPGPQFNQFLARSSLVHILFGVAMAIGLVCS